MKHKVWRFQRSFPAGEVVSAMTHDRRLALHFRLDEVWLMNFRGRSTFYAEARVLGSAQKPRMQILRETTKEDWK